MGHSRRIPRGPAAEGDQLRRCSRFGSLFVPGGAAGAGAGQRAGRPGGDRFRSTASEGRPAGGGALLGRGERLRPDAGRALRRRRRSHDRSPVGRRSQEAGRVGRACRALAEDLRRSLARGRRIRARGACGGFRSRASPPQGADRRCTRRTRGRGGGAVLVGRAPAERRGSRALGEAAPGDLRGPPQRAGCGEASRACAAVAAQSSRGVRSSRARSGKGGGRGDRFRRRRHSGEDRFARRRGASCRRPGRRASACQTGIRVRAGQRGASACSGPRARKSSPPAWDHRVGQEGRRADQGVAVPPSAWDGPLLPKVPDAPPIRRAAAAAGPFARRLQSLFEDRPEAVERLCAAIEARAAVHGLRVALDELGRELSQPRWKGRRPAPGQLERLAAAARAQPEPWTAAAGLLLARFRIEPG